MNHLLEELSWIGLQEIKVEHDTQEHYGVGGQPGMVERRGITIEATIRLHGEERLEVLAAVVRIARTIVPDDWEATLRGYAAQAMLVSKEGGD